MARLAACVAAAAAVGAPAAAGAQPPGVLSPRAVLRPPGGGGGRVARVVGRAVGAALGRAAGRIVRDVRARRAAKSSGAAAEDARALVPPPRPAPGAADTPVADTPAADEPFRLAIDEFAAAAARGDTLRALALLDTPGRLRPEVLPFFAARPRLGGPTTVAGSDDAAGRECRTYYLYAAPAGDGEPRPVVFTVTRDGGRPRVSGVLVDYLVVGRHR